jgi:hypothetical protein
MPEPPVAQAIDISKIDISTKLAELFPFVVFLSSMATPSPRARRSAKPPNPEGSI